MNTRDYPTSNFDINKRSRTQKGQSKNELFRETDNTGLHKTRKKQNKNERLLGTTMRKQTQIIEVNERHFYCYSAFLSRVFNNEKTHTLATLKLLIIYKTMTIFFNKFTIYEYKWQTFGV